MNMPEVAQRRSQDLCKQLKQKALQHQLTVKSLQLSLQSSSSQMFVGVLAMALQPFIVVLLKSCSETFWKTPGKENICIGVSFSIELQGYKPELYKKRTSSKNVFQQILPNFLEKLFAENLPQTTLLSAVYERLLLSMYCQQ